MTARPAASDSNVIRDLVLTRVFDAPRALVWQAWTDPQHVARWWGPKRFSNPVCQWPAQPGGEIHVDMTGPGGEVFPMGGAFKEVVEPERLVFTATAMPDEHGVPALENLNTVTFTEEHGRTTMKLHVQVLRAAPAAAQALAGMNAGWSQSLDKLAGEVSARTDVLDREIVMTRLFDAPRALVWEAWTQLEHLVQWWGPQGFTITNQHRDFRPGGSWRFVMHGPDGRDYENLMTFLEIVEGRSLEYKQGGAADGEPIHFQVQVQFLDAGPDLKQTKLVMRLIFPSAQAKDFVINTCNAVEGGKQTMARLSAHLDALQTAPRPGGQDFVISRVVRAPRELVWKLWTEREELMKWFGPKGVTMPRCTLDLRPGGVFHYLMQGPADAGHWGKWVFREIVPPEKLVCVVSFADEQGNSIRAPWEADWPLEMLSVITFLPHAGVGGGTVVTVRWNPLNATLKEQQVFAAGQDSMRQGWTGTFEELEARLAGL